MDNAYYFYSISEIGGIETFLYQLVKENKDKNITIFYQFCDAKQLKRLNKYCNLVQYTKGMKITAKKVFFNFNLDPLENGDVEAEEKILIVHGNYKYLNCKPPQNKQITKVYAVSKVAASAYKELTGIDCEVVYNPLKIEKKKTLFLMSATRLDQSTEDVKGCSRMVELANKLDQYCLENDFDYQWHIYSSNKIELENSHLQILNPTLDIQQYIKRYDYLIQLSDNVEGFNYSVNEALVQGVPIVATECDVYKELGISEEMAIWLDFDLTNLDQVVEDMFNRTFNFKYTPPKSQWSKLLYKGKKEKTKPIKLVMVVATDKSKKEQVAIKELGRIAFENEIFETTEERKKKLIDLGYCQP